MGLGSRRRMSGLQWVFRRTGHVGHVGQALGCRRRWLVRELLMRNGRISTASARMN